MAWLAGLPAGKLNQWMAWEQVEPMGETWMQVARVLEAIYLPIYARAGSDAPEAADYMPERYRRPRKSVASDIRAAIQNSDAIARQMKAIMGTAK